MAVTDQPSPLAWSRRALPPLAALLALYVAMPWVVRPLEAWLSPGTVARIGQAAEIGIGAALAAWVLALLRRQQRLAQRHALELEQLTLTDPLTGLGSQRAFVRDLDLAINRSRRTGESVTVLLFDVEGFQALTARHGRSTGDLTLRTLGAVLRSSVRFGSDMGYRVGPNEFAMVLAADRRGAESVGRRVEWNFRERSPRHSPLSAGFAAWDGRAGAYEMLEQAKRAMLVSRRATLAVQMA